MKSMSALILALLACILGQVSGRSARDATRLSDVNVLTLRHDAMAQGRRTPPMPELTCVDGNACEFYAIDVMQCRNLGSKLNAGGDGQDHGTGGEKEIEWACSATLPQSFRLGSTDVVCEGYDSPDDPFITRGSCAVEYTLHLTEEGERRLNAKYDRHPGFWSKVPGWIWWGLKWYFYLFVALAIVMSIRAFLSRYSNSRGYARNDRRGPSTANSAGTRLYPRSPSHPPPPPYSETAAYDTSTASSGSASPSSTGSTGAGIGIGSAAARGMNKLRGLSPTSWMRQRRQRRLDQHADSWQTRRTASSQKSFSDSKSPSPFTDFGPSRTSTGFGVTRRR
ncbi:hypothetical protein PYCC9005_004351 [Savitreella phatthalungensis]